MSDIIIREDFDVRNQDGTWKKMFNTPSGVSGVKVKHHTLSYCRWLNLKVRTCDNKAYLSTRPNYSGVSNNFNCFDGFVEWSINEIGYNEKENIGGVLQNFHLEKDLLSGRSGKIYSPETCLFVPQKVNMFTCIKSRNKIKDLTLPVGVVFHKRDKKFMAQISTEGKYNFLGYFTNKIDAHRAWQLAKINYGEYLASEYKETHPKMSHGLVLWTAAISEDFKNGLFSEF